jgi:exopolyphosphatase/guanosine-5'-triphosphate,3'-diphosphate pyrophosphatase
MHATGAWSSVSADASTPVRVAAVDIGSNTALLLIADLIDGVWHPVREHAEICRVSEGLDQSGVLADVPVERTRSVVERFGLDARALNVDRIVAVGTAPFRRAANGAQVAAGLSAALGADIEVVSGEREAALSLAATRAAFGSDEDLLVVDIGGASTELIAANADGTNEALSLDIGAVRLTERCVSAHPFPARDRDALRGAIGEALAAPGVRGILHGRPRTLVGVAGTVTSLCTASLELEVWDAERVHGHRLPVSEIHRLGIALSHLTVSQRAALPGVPAKRADVLPAGAMLLGAIAVAADVREVVVSDRGVRWGLLAELLAAAS